MSYFILHYLHNPRFPIGGSNPPPHEFGRYHVRADFTHEVFQAFRVELPSYIPAGDPRPATLQELKSFARQGLQTPGHARDAIRHKKSIENVVRKN